MSKRSLLLTGIVFLIIAFSGAAQAAIASSGGGLSSSLSGAGFSSAAGSLSAGHSASAAKTLTQTLVAAGTFSTTTSGTESATDGTVTVNVQASNLRITGFLDGPGTATATASIAANGDEGPVPLFPAIWVNTLVGAVTDVNVAPGTHGTATASATGTANARGTLAGVGTVTALSQGTATARSDARDLFANGATSQASGMIWSDAALDDLGTAIALDNDMVMMPIKSEVGTAGGATASSTASGVSRATGTSATQSGSIGISGRTAASAATTGDFGSTMFTTGGYSELSAQMRDDGGANYQHGESAIGTLFTAFGQDGTFLNYGGTASGSATGTVSVTGRDVTNGETISLSAAGTASGTASQTGAGESQSGSGIFSEYFVNANTWIITGFTMQRMVFGNDWNLLAIHGLETFSLSQVSSDSIVTETGNGGSGSASASGNAATQVTFGAAPGVPGDQAGTSARGNTAASGSLEGTSRLVAISSVMSHAETGPTIDYHLNFGPVLGSFDTDAGAVSDVNARLELTGGGIPADMSGSVSANGATSGNALYNDGVRQAHASTSAGANIQGTVSGGGADPQFGADTYAFAFTGPSSTGGPLFASPDILSSGTATTDFAITQSALEADAQVLTVLDPAKIQTSGGRVTGGTAHGDAGFSATGVQSANAISDAAGGTDVNIRTRDAIGFSETWIGSTQGAAYFPAGDASDVWTFSYLAADADNPTGAAGSIGSFSAGLTGTRTSGRGTLDNIVPADPYTVSSDASASGTMRSGLTTAGVSSAVSQTAAYVDSLGTHAVTADTDDAAIDAYYFAYDNGMDGMNQRGTAAITGLSLAGHSASEADSARLAMNGGSAQVTLTTLSNSALITFPIRTAVLGGSSPGAPPFGLGMIQGVRTDSSVTAAPNFAYGEWAGAVDSRDSAPTIPWPIP